MSQVPPDPHGHVLGVQGSPGDVLTLDNNLHAVWAQPGGGGAGLPPQWSVDEFGNLSIDSGGGFIPVLEVLGESIGGGGAAQRSHLQFYRAGGLEVRASSGGTPWGSVITAFGGGCTPGGAGVFAPGGGDGGGADDQLGVGLVSSLGAGSNDWTLAAVNDGASQPLSIEVDTPGKAIVVHLATDGGGAVTSTWDDVAAALASHGGPIDFSYVNLGTTSPAPFAPVQFSGGNDEVMWDGEIILGLAGHGQTMPMLRLLNSATPGAEFKVTIDGKAHAPAFVDPTGDLRTAIEELIPDGVSFPPGGSMHLQVVPGGVGITVSADAALPGGSPLLSLNDSDGLNRLVVPNQGEIFIDAYAGHPESEPIFSIFESDDSVRFFYVAAGHTGITPRLTVKDAGGNTILDVDGHTGGSETVSVLKDFQTAAGAKVGFFGHAPVVQQAHPADLADVITALQTFGLVA